MGHGFSLADVQAMPMHQVNSYLAQLVPDSPPAEPESAPELDDGGGTVRQLVPLRRRSKM